MHWIAWSPGLHRFPVDMWPTSGTDAFNDTTLHKLIDASMENRKREKEREKKERERREGESMPPQSTEGEGKRSKVAQVLTLSISV